MNARNRSPFAQIELSAPHWVLQERQLVNWGSYDGYHTFRPTTKEDGTVTLLTGQSESGKSTLVDAQVSLLYPTGAAFNKASNAGRSDRTDYSYLRGYRGTQNEHGHDEPRYLRGANANGEPYPLWGAIVDTYIDSVNGGVFSIAKFLFLPAGNGSEGLVKLFASADSRIDPRLMDSARHELLNLPVLKRLFPEANVYKQAKQFHEDVWRRFGLTEAACHLLHRMQASDAPSQLNDIFRKGVLEEPSAIEHGMNTIQDYEGFASNFAAMEINQQRVDQLERIAAQYEEYSEEKGEINALAAINPENPEAEETRKAWLVNRIREDVEEMLPLYEGTAQSSKEKASEVEGRVKDLQARLEGVKDQMRGKGGDRLEQLRERLESAKRDRAGIQRTRTKLGRKLEEVGAALPQTSEEWNTLTELSQEFLDAFEQRRKENQHAQWELFDKRKRLTEQTDALRQDYERQKNSRRRISKSMSEARALIARATGLDESELPYVAELMDVNEANEAWRTAMNVCYSSIAQIILVSKTHEEGFAAKVSQIPREAMDRRHWQFVDLEETTDASSREGWMSSKLKFNEDSPFVGWVRNRVTQADVDAKCVQSIDDLNRIERQIQTDGQLKDGKKGSHGTKNVRSIIGFVTEAYLRELEEQIEACEREAQGLQGQLDELQAAQQQLEVQHEAAKVTSENDWDEIDITKADQRVMETQQEIDAIRKNPELEQLIHERDELSEKLDRAQQNLHNARSEHNAASRALQASRSWLELNRSQECELVPACEELLQESYRSYFGVGSDVTTRTGQILNLDSSSSSAGSAHAKPVTDRTQLVFNRLLKGLADSVSKELARLHAECENRRETCEQNMDSYKERFMKEDERVGASVEDFQFFQRELEEMQQTVIRESSDFMYFSSMEKTYKDLQELDMCLRTDRAKILEQIGKINQLLARYPFGAHHGKLSIEATVNPPEADFRSALTTSLSNVAEYYRGKQSVELCKKTFRSLKPFIELLKLSFTEFSKNGKGNTNLDPRQRSRFLGQVTHPNGVVESIDSTGGGSGGYLQELTSFAYGAALMYLLANDNATEPSYATVFLDEALIKADGQYTKRALSVLPGLGFQVIVSAPESKTGEIMGSASKVVVATKDPATGTTTLRAATLAGDSADGTENDSDSDSADDSRETAEETSA